MKHANKVSIVAILLSVGCGGKQLLEISGDDAGASSLPRGSGSDVPGNGASGGGRGSSTGSGGTGTGSGTTPGSPGNPTVSDGGVAVRTDAGPSTLVTCGKVTCDSAREECCIDTASGGAQAACSPVGKCQGARLECSSAENCANGEVCCASFFGGMAGARCRPSCSGGGGGGGGGGGNAGGPQLCNRDSECPPGESCKPTPFGVKICRPGR